MADTAVTIANNRLTPLKEEERVATGCNWKAKVIYTDIAFGAGSTDTVTMTLGATPAKFLIDKAFANVTTAFAGTGGLAIKVGATDDDFAIASVSILSAGILQGSSGPNVVAAPSGGTGTSAQTLKAIFTNSVSGSPSALSAGEMDIYLNIQDTSRLP